MAISRSEYSLLRNLRASGMVPKKPHLLELGEANWYQDVPVQELADDIRRLAEPDSRERLYNELAQTLERRNYYMLFEIAQICYAAFLDHASSTAIDLNGTPRCLRLDLNQPLKLERQFDVVVNTGTGEHVFDVRQFFTTVHDWTRPGGLMVHGMPFNGAVDHGFFNFQPTFYWDLAAANGYQVLGLYYSDTQPDKSNRMLRLENREHILRMNRDGEIALNAGLFCVFCKAETERPFQIPLQGYYADTLSEEAKQSWLVDR